MAFLSRQPIILQDEGHEELERHVSYADGSGVTNITCPLSLTCLQCIKMAVESGIEVSSLIAYIEHIYPVSFWRLVSNSLALNTRKNAKDLVLKNIAGILTVSTSPKEIWSKHINPPILYVATAATASKCPLGQYDIWMCKEKDNLGKVKIDQLFIRSYTICSISLFTMNPQVKFMLQEPVTAAQSLGKGKTNRFLRALNALGVGTSADVSMNMTIDLAAKNEDLCASIITSAIKHEIPLGMGFDNLDQNNSVGGTHVMAFALFFLAVPLASSPTNYTQLKFQELKEQDVTENKQDEVEALTKMRDQMIMNASLAQRDDRKTDLISMKLAGGSLMAKPSSRKQLGRPKDKAGEEYAQAISSSHSGNMSKMMRSAKNELARIQSTGDGAVVKIQHSYSPLRHDLTTPRDARVLSVMNGEVVSLIQQFNSQKVAIIERRDGAVGYVPLSAISGDSSDFPKNPFISTPLLQSTLQKEGSFDRMSAIANLEHMYGSPKENVAIPSHDKHLNRSLLSQFSSEGSATGMAMCTLESLRSNPASRSIEERTSRFRDEVHGIVAKLGGGYPIRYPTSFILLNLVDARAGDSLQAKNAIEKNIKYIEMIHRNAREEDALTPDLNLLKCSDNQETHEVYKEQESHRISVVRIAEPIKRFLARLKDRPDGEEPNEVEQQARQQLSELNFQYNNIANDHPQCIGSLHGGFTSVRSFYALHGDLCMRGIVFRVGYGAFYDKIAACVSGWYKTCRVLIQKSSHAWFYVIVKVLNAVLGRQLTPQQIKIILPHIRRISDTGKACFCASSFP